MTERKGDYAMPEDKKDTRPGAVPVADEEEGVLDPDDPGEVGTRFVTKGRGWSGRDKGEDE